MKLNQLLERENFYKILVDTLTENSFFDGKKTNKENVIFKCFDKLNIIHNESIDFNVIKKLTFEYSLSKSLIKKFLQNIYIIFFSLPKINNLLVNNRIYLSNDLVKYAIIPGNHRVRLYGKELNKIIVLLKKNENKKFIKNDIAVRFDNSISYAPKIISYGNDWLVEEFVEGVPFNRVNTDNNLLFSIIRNHNDELIKLTKKPQPLKKYIDFCKDEITTIVDLIPDKEEIKREINHGLNEIFEKLLKLELNQIDVSSTHGDFQEGNIRINNQNMAYVIDWEAADYRFFMYDFFVLLSGIRTGKNIYSSFDLFFSQLNLFNFDLDEYSKKSLVLLLSFEELRFNLNEKISLNFFESKEYLNNIFFEINRNFKKYE